MGKRGPEPGHAYGAAAVTKVLHGVNFPCSKSDIMSRYGNKEIEWTKGNPQRLSDIIGCVPDETYNSPADLEHALSKCR